MMHWEPCPGLAELLCSEGIQYHIYYIDGLVQERRNYSALALELRISCTNPPIYVSYAELPITEGMLPH